MMIRLLTLVIFLLHLNTSIYAQSKDDNLKNTIVELNAKVDNHIEVGTGFVIAKNGSQVIIVTAKHVTLDLDSVDVKFEKHDTTIKGEVVFRHDNYDLAVISVNNPSYQFTPLNYAVNAEGGDQVFSRGSNQNKMILSNNGAAMITKIDREQIAANLTAQKGDSGSPLFTGDYLIGMIYEAPGLAIPISLVKLIVEDNDLPWQLTKRTIDRVLPEIKKIEPSNLIEIDYHSLYLDGEHALAANVLKDGILSTSWICKEAGWHNLSILRSTPKFIKSVRFFYPSTFSSDFPNGELVLNKANKSFKLQTILSKVMKKEQGGNWVEFIFPDFYLEDHITLRFKVNKDSKEQPEPVTFFEIKLIGLSN